MQMDLKYHHIGIPNTEVRENEYFLERYGMYIVGHEHSAYGVEWLRFEADSPLPKLVKTVPHVAFEVDDLEAALQGKKILIEPNMPSQGVRVAFIVENGAPIEFLEFEKTDSACD